MGELIRRPDELRGMSDLGFSELRAAVGGIGGVHRAVAGRAFGAAGPAARPARALHDAITEGVYAGLRGAYALLGAGAGAILGMRQAGDGRELSTSVRGGTVLGVLNGLVGDSLERDGSDLQEPIAVRLRGRVVEPRPESLAVAFPDAGPRLVVLLHGLMETELAWRFGAGPGGETYATRIARDLGCTPVELRYNSGRHISENGRSVSELLEALVGSWPVPVEQLALVGHSMGGLVARSACHHASREGAGWVGHVRQVVSLGSPHMGAPLAQAVHYASAALHAIPEARPFGAFLRRRSAGIRDLRQGSLVDEDWRDRDPNALRAAACQEVPLLEGAVHYFVAATVTADPRHPLGRLIGDALVLEGSASGRSPTRRIPFEAEHGMQLGGVHHLALLNHPAVYRQLRDWLGAEAPAPARRAAGPIAVSPARALA